MKKGRRVRMSRRGMVPAPSPPASLICGWVTWCARRRQRRPVASLWCSYKFSSSYMYIYIYIYQLSSHLVNNKILKIYFRFFYYTLDKRFLELILTKLYKTFSYIVRTNPILIIHHFYKCFIEYIILYI